MVEALFPELALEASSSSTHSATLLIAHITIKGCLSKPVYGLWGTNLKYSGKQDDMVAPQWM